MISNEQIQNDLIEETNTIEKRKIYPATRIKMHEQTLQILLDTSSEVTAISKRALQRCEKVTPTVLK